MSENNQVMQVPGPKNNIVKIDEAVLEKRIDEKIREGIETTLNALLDEEVGQIAGRAFHFAGRIVALATRDSNHARG